MPDYICPQCKIERTPNEARAQHYRCTDCGAWLLARSAAPVVLPVTARRRTAPEAEPNPPEPVSAAAPTRPTLDDLRNELQQQLAARRAEDATAPAAAAPDPDASPEAPAPPARPTACLVLPPVENERDAATMEQMLSTLGHLSSPVALEIAADAKERKLILRAEPEALQRAKEQLYGAYDRAEIEDLPPGDDPSLTGGGAVWAGACLRPSRAEFLPLKTWREFKEQEPLGTLLGAFSGLRSGEAAVAQVIVRDAAPKGWADAHLQQLAALQRRGYGAELPAPAKNIWAFLGAVVCFIFAGTAGLWMMGSLWPRLFLAVPLGVGFGYLGLRLMRVSRSPWLASLDEDAVEKLRAAALLIEVRLFAAAASPERAQHLLDRLVDAYRLFDTASGNSFEAAPLPDSVQPTVFTTPPDAAKAARPAILSVKEVAGLWHLPVLAALELVKRQTYERVLPRPDDVNDPLGAPIGLAQKGDRAIPVALSRVALDANTFIVGMTQMGKSTLMGQIAMHLARDPGRTLIVVDPHGDLVRRLTGLLPPARRDDILYLDFTDPERVVGLNLLDTSDGSSPYAVAERFVDIGRALWADYWGPRMVVPLFNSLQALAHANTQRPPDRQLTILALSTLLTCDPEIREAFLNREVPPEVAPTVHRYFTGEFNDSSNSFREQVLSPVLSKANAFERSPAILRLVGQPRSTVQLIEAIQQHKIILVNTASGALGADLAGFLGSLFVNLMRLVIARQESLPADQRVRVTLIADEFQTMPGVAWPKLLGELQKDGGGFILATQGLGNLLQEQINRAIVESIFAGARTTIAFGTNGADAYYLTKHQLGAEQLRPSSLMDLPRGVAYIKTLDASGRPIPAYTVAVNPLPAADPAAQQDVLKRRAAYTVSAAEADRLYRQSLAALDEYARPGPTTVDMTRALAALDAANAAPKAPGDPDTNAAIIVTPTRALRGVPVPDALQGRAAAYAQTPPGGPASEPAAPAPEPEAWEEPEPPDEEPGPAPAIPAPTLASVARRGIVMARKPGAA
jgi:hypothetical protein